MRPNIHFFLVTLLFFAGCKEEPKTVAGLQSPPPSQEENERAKLDAEEKAKIDAEIAKWESDRIADEKKAAEAKEAAEAAKAAVAEEDKKEFETKGQSTGPIVATDVKISSDAAVAPTKNLPNVAKVVELVKTGAEVPYDLLTQAFIDLHEAKRTNKHWTRKQLNAFLDKATPELVGLLDKPRDFQMKLEELVIKHAGLNAIDYEKGHNNLFDVFGGLNQCYSGTSFYTVARRVMVSKAKNLGPQHAVVLFTKGHILPGYFVRESGEWIVRKNETTYAGSDVNSVAVKDLPEHEVRIALENDVLLSEVLKAASSEKDRNEFMASALKRCADTYGLPLDKMEEVVAKVPNPGVLDPTALGSIVFGFGQSDVKAGMRRRTYNARLREEEGTATVTYDETKTIRNPKWTPQNSYRSGNGGEMETISVSTGRKASYQTSSCPPIFEMIRAGDYAGAKKLLESGYNPNVSSKHSCHGGYVDVSSPFHAAMDMKDLKMAELILQHGFDVFASPSRRYSFTEPPTIITALRSKRADYLRLIVKYSAKNIDTPMSNRVVDGRYKEAYTALSMAIELDEAEAVEILVKAGANPDYLLREDFSVRDFAQFLKTAAGQRLPSKK